MADSTQFDNVLKLGKQLVAELGFDQSADTLSRWMAHYIAELIHNAEIANEENRDEQRSKCAGAILELWSHYTAIPNGKRPFQDYDPILRTLESLDPNSNIPRYFRPVHEAAVKQQKNTESATWLESAEKVDYTARLLIRFCLTCAARDAIEKSKEWVTLAEAAGAVDDNYFSVIRFVSNEAELSGEETATNEERKEIESRIKRLEDFINLAKMLSDHLQEKLDTINNQNKI
ncbi:AVAST type 3 anti-phage protein Avs3b [Nitrosomonas sp. Is35]|uniref:AVAST type 3 anti-phage proein Avs3b n=1 Tax=Nitrosomonas sp. Is35 TaxID=3080534 RepID=UPI00294B4DB3|nr:AVAST type 3 anti-phage proein Avs3b [Nitrosomonas sp. Is35]MDV6346523.1 AVAST type 3 anti-phage protein Avs3b [Nitrosomonas sp. Is35]